MFKRIFVCAMVLAAMVCLSGCGDQKQSTNADKAVLAYAELITHGDSPNLEAAGLTEADKIEIRKEIIKAFIDSLAEVAPLSDQSAQIVTATFYEKFTKDMNFVGGIKKDDAEHPVVEIKTTPMDYEGATKAAAANDEMIVLIGMVGQLKADGATDEELKNNNDVQVAAVTALTKYIKSIPMQGEKTFEVTCNKVKGTDGKDHWAPADMEALAKFITGQP